MENYINLNSFLKFGFFLNYKNKNAINNFSLIDKQMYKSYSKDDLIDIGINLWRQIFEKSFKSHKKHLVPISGGLDSRAILAALLEYTDASNITTYTFGQPGALDYDIGNSIAKLIGTKHFALPLNEHSYSLDEELVVSKNIDFQTVLFLHPPILKLLDYFSDYVHWSGYGGGEIAGSHLAKNPSDNFETAKIDFYKRNTFVKSTNISNTSLYDFDFLLKENFLDHEVVTLEEQLDFNHRQTKFICPHVLINGFIYETPFIDDSWFQFMMSINNKYRFNTNLYKQILLKAYPKLFKFKTKSNLGLPLDASKYKIFLHKITNRIKPYLKKQNINYLDFNDSIRVKEDFKNLIYSNIMDLNNRKLIDWIDIEKIWKNHQNNIGNHADALMVLASLEIHLKAGKKI